MRKFHSYGPVDSRKHFYVQREDLIQNNLESLIDDPDDCGHFFTIWAPRQTGKTWLIKQTRDLINKKFGDKFTTGIMSMQRVIMKDDEPDEVLLKKLPRLFEICFKKKFPIPGSWDEFIDWFSRDNDHFDRPVILMIDEFDKLPPCQIDNIVTLFQEIYLDIDQYWLHGLALIGVRAVLGFDSDKGSPFNIQRSLHVPNLTFEETSKMFNEYQEESNQKIERQVVEKIYEMTNGQPGLIGWFGELLTETYNGGYDKTIDLKAWKLVEDNALFVEPNNNLMNLIAKAKKSISLDFVINLFSKPEIPFSFHNPVQNHLYMNGIINKKIIENQQDGIKKVVQFSSPFVQKCLFHALGVEVSDTLNQTLTEKKITELALNPLDLLEDVFKGPSLNIPPLIQRYKDYLARLRQKGINPWKDQPRRKTDFHLTEAVGHFHLYFWLQLALSGRCAIIPEFPTGNGKVDLHIKCKDKSGLIEVKSFINAFQLQEACKQAAEYALETKYKDITVAMFVPFIDEDVVEQISMKKVIDGINVDVVAIGQG